VVTSEVSCLSSNRLRSIQKHQTPVVGVNYLFSCVEAGVLLPVDEYKLDISSALSAPPPPSSVRRAPLINQGTVMDFLTFIISFSLNDQQWLTVSIPPHPPTLLQLKTNQPTQPVG